MTKLAKTHHRKVEPWRPGWARELHVWPYLVRIEFLATVIVTVVPFVWSITLNAPLEEPANPNLTMNPSKAPWYFLGLQEVLVYFRSVDRGRRDALDHHGRLDGLSVRRLESTRQRLLHAATAALRALDVWRELLQWILLIVIGTFIRGTGLDLVLAGTDGITTPSCSIKTSTCTT